VTKRRRRRQASGDGARDPRLGSYVPKMGWQNPWLLMGDLRHDDVIEIPCHTAPGFASKLMINFPASYVEAYMAAIGGYMVHDSNLIDGLVDAYRLYMARNGGREPDAVEIVREPLYWFRPVFGSTRRTTPALPGVPSADIDAGMSRIAGDVMVHPGPVRIVVWFAVHKIAAMRPGR